jgi:hypothetical protein
MHIAPLTNMGSASSIIAINCLLYRAGGRPLSFSRLISGGSRSPEPVEGNAEGPPARRAYASERASLPAIASRSGEAGGNPPLISRRKDQAGSLGTEEKTS